MIGMKKITVIQGVEVMIYKVDDYRIVSGMPETYYTVVDLSGLVVGMWKTLAAAVAWAEANSNPKHRPGLYPIEDQESESK